jgi:hypothetical protein
MQFAGDDARDVEPYTDGRQRLLINSVPALFYPSGCRVRAH